MRQEQLFFIFNKNMKTIKRTFVLNMPLINELVEGKLIIENIDITQTILAILYKLIKKLIQEHCLSQKLKKTLKQLVILLHVIVSKEAHRSLQNKKRKSPS